MGWQRGVLIKIENEKLSIDLGHLLDLRCCDLVWLQLNPGGGFPVNLWSLSRRCLSDLYLSATHGKWRRLSWQWVGLHAISGWLLCLTMLWLYWQPQPWAPVPSLPCSLPLSLDAFKSGEYRGWMFFRQEMSHSLLSSPGKFNSTALDNLRGKRKIF